MSATPSPAARPSARSAVEAVVANPALRRIELAWALGVAGDAAFTVALLVAAFAYGGATAVGILTAVRMAPSIVGAPLAGLLAGRRPPTNLLFLAHLIRAVAAIATLAGLAADQAIAVLGAATVASSAGAFVRPLQIAAMPTIARTPDELVAANVVSGVGEGTGSFVGPLLAGLVLGLAGPLTAATIAAVLFVLAAAGLGGRIVGDDAAAEQDAERRHGREGMTVAAAARELTAGLRALARHRGAAAIMAALGAQVFVRGLMTTLTVVTSIRLVGLGEPGVGTLTAAYGLGTLGGAVLAVRLAGGGRLAPPFAVSLSIWGLPLAIIAAIPHPAVAIGGLVVSGLANGTLDVAAFTLLQRGVPRSDRVAVFGVLEAVASLGVAGGGAVAPLLVGAFGDRGALALAGAILPIAAVALWARVYRVDRDAILPERQLRLLRGVPLFAPLPLTALERLAEAVRPVHVAAGTTILREGEPGRDYFLIESGEVEISAAGHPIATGRAGDGFGEIALLKDVPRTATVVARTAVELELVESSEFLAAVAGPSSAAAAAAVVDERLARSAAAG
ncbi:MAG TPA: cyclic nucleotide-binding domain-containing protein [Candidatus Limnocylindrales bacterium]|nr:cyclic nucleotide-binding domain-containing protein [Candidatus Limnocylindrales bacterium]